ncbi:MAG: hypothetical protein ACJ8R9_30900 [Steroidobacteraceae bacterium]
MRPITPTAPRRDGSLILAACAAAMLLLSGCHKALSSADSRAAASGERPANTGPSEPKSKDDQAATDQGPEEGVVLKPEEIEKVGIVTAEARAITNEPEVSGFGVVVAHETIAQAVAELRTAAAAARQSRSAYERSHRLAGTPGAMPAEAQETAERQAAADEAALQLARQRLSSTFGQNPPWKGAENSPELLALASGQSKLVRLTFPLGSLDDATATKVRLGRINASQAGTSWQARSVWRAPADASVPGKSFFAILKDSDASEGDHLLAWASVGAPETGVLIPASAAILSAGKFWCYLEEKPGTFVRTSFDPGRPTTEGYFVKQGVSVGDKIVTASAGQLLARETNPGTEAE